MREYQDEFVPRHALILDTFAQPRQDEAFEEAVSIAASFACTIDTQESLLDLLFAGPRAICFTTGRGLGQAEQALELLASVQRNPTDTIEPLQNLVLQHAGLVCDCVCVFLRWDDARRELVRKLRVQGLPVLVLVVRAAPATDSPSTAASAASSCSAAASTSSNASAVPPDSALAGQRHDSQVLFLEPGRIAEGLAQLEAIS